MTTPLDRNVEAYARKLPELLPKYEGKYVLMHEMRVISFFPTYEAALEAGYAEFRRAPFFVAKVVPRQTDDAERPLGACPH